MGDSLLPPTCRPSLGTFVTLSSSLRCVVGETIAMLAAVWQCCVRDDGGGGNVPIEASVHSGCRVALLWTASLDGAWDVPGAPIQNEFHLPSAE